MPHWSDQHEAAGRVWQMRLMYRLYHSLNRSFITVLLRLTVFFFYLFSPEARRVSRKFLGAVASLEARPAPRLRDVLNHFHCFAYTLLEKLSAWASEIKVKDLDLIGPDLGLILAQLQKRQGAVVLCSHLGNTEMLRALASLEAGVSLPPFGVNSIVDFSGTSKFNRLLQEINPASMFRLYHASAIGVETIIDLSRRLEQGDLVVIAADRTAARNRTKTGRVTFLGREAHFPLGAFVLASLLDAPIYHMFGVRRRDLDFTSPYEFHLHRSRYDLRGSRKERMDKIQGLMEEYVGLLEGLCRAHPFQWYNFFDFWTPPAGN